MTRRAIVLVVCAAAWLGGCASRGPARPSPFPSPSRPAPEAAEPAPGAGGEPLAAPGTEPAPAPVPRVSGRTGESIARDALAFVGTPYRYGGGDPQGFDCSGLVHYVYGRHGVLVPRQVVDLFSTGRRLASGSAAPGDLLFFATKRGEASHVAIALGGGRFVHAPSEGGAVRVESLASTYWARRFLGVRRLTRD